LWILGTTLAALSDLNIVVPQEVSVIGHDNIRMAEMIIPPLTTIGFESSDLAERLIASVISVYQGGPALEIPALKAKDVVRGSA
jgi:LacI family transcriptional regulator